MSKKTMSVTDIGAVSGIKDVVVRDCEISSACSAFRFGGNNILIENCNVYGPCKYQFRGTFTHEEQISGAITSKVARNNMLCFYTNFVTDDLPVKKQVGNILIRNCKVNGADKLFHLNLSGNGPWQRGNSPTDVTFENITAHNIQTGLCTYGDEEVPFSLKLKNVDYSFREGSETEPFMKAAHFGEIVPEDVRVSNYKGIAFIKTWLDGGEIVTKNFDCDILDNELRVRATEKFTCNPI